jgi:hypothetical protein
MSSPQQTNENFFDALNVLVFGPKPLTPEENVKKWQQEIAKEKRNIDRQIRSTQREQVKVQREIKILIQKVAWSLRNSLIS